MSTSRLLLEAHLHNTQTKTPSQDDRISQALPAIRYTPTHTYASILHARHDAHMHAAWSCLSPTHAICRFMQLLRPRPPVVVLQAKTLLPLTQALPIARGKLALHVVQLGYLIVTLHQPTDLVAHSRAQLHLLLLECFHLALVIEEPC